MRSVGQAFEAFAEVHSIPATEVVRAKVDEHLEPSLPPRYRHLTADVFLRLPEGWDSHAHWTMCAAEIASVDVHLAGARRLEAEPGCLQRWEVRLVAHELEHYSAAAVRWVIAHELAHVASGLPTDLEERDDALHEDRADHLAALWGFQEEYEAFEAQRTSEKRGA